MGMDGNGCSPFCFLSLEGSQQALGRQQMLLWQVMSASLVLLKPLAAR
jgi:hypothetical protein